MTDLDRWVRNSIHGKQNRMSIKEGAPRIEDLTEGVPVFRKIDDEIVLFLKSKNTLYNTYLTKVLNNMRTSDDVHSEFNATSIDSHLIPKETEKYDLGSSDNKWNDLYLEGRTIYIGNMTIGVDGTGSDAKIKIRNTDSADEDGGDLSVKSDSLLPGTAASTLGTRSGDIVIEQIGTGDSVGDVKIKVPDGQVIEFYEGGTKQAWISSTGIFTCNWLNLNGGTSVTMIVDNLNASGNTTLVTQNAVVTGLNAKQDTLTFGKLSGNALKSEEALDTGEVLLMGTNHVQGLPAASFKDTLNILGQEGGTLTGQLILNATDGNSTPSTDGHILDTDNTTFNDATTSLSGTYAQFYAYKLSKATLTATNGSVTTTDAATLYLEGDTVASTNQTITNNYALQLGGGNIKLPNDSKIIFGDAGENISGDGTDLTIASSGDITLDANGGDVTIEDTGTSKPRLVLKNTAEQYGSPPIISFEVTPSNYGSGTNTGASGDDIGRLDFKSNDDAGNETTYVKILSEISVATDGQEGGKLSLQVASHDAEMNNGLIIEDGSEEDEVDVTIGNGDNSATIIKGKLSFGSNPTIVNSILDEDNMATNSNSALATQQSIKAYVDSSDKFFCTSAFYHGANNLEYIPIAGGSTVEFSTLYDSGNDDTTFIVPYNLKINTIYVSATRGRSTDEIAGSTNMRLYKNYAQLSANVTVDMSTIGYDSTDLATVYTFDFSGETNTYAAGDIMQISIDPTLKLYYVSITIVGLYT